MLRILRGSEVDKQYGTSRSTRYKLEAEGKFPKRRRISDRATGYYEHELDEWAQTLPLADDTPIKMPAESSQTQK